MDEILVGLLKAPQKGYLAPQAPPILPKSAAKRRYCLDGPGRRERKGERGEGEGGRGRICCVYGHLLQGDSRTAVLPMISCRQSQKMTRFADCGPAAIRDLTPEDLSGQYIAKKKRDGAHM